MDTNKEEQITIENNFPSDELWRLFQGIHSAENLGFLRFECEDEEPGRVFGMGNAFSAMLDNLNARLTIKEIKELHFIALDGVNLASRYEGSEPTIEVKGKFRELNEGGMTECRQGVSISPEGIKELMSKECEHFWGVVVPSVRNEFEIDETERKNIPALFNELIEKILKGEKFAAEEQSLCPIYPSEENLFLNYTLLTGAANVESSEQYVQILIERYYAAMERYSNKDSEKKLRLIVQLIQDLHQYHPFYLGNGRTICILVLNKLLMQNGFPPVILYRLEIFNCLSISEMVLEVKMGMINYLSFICPELKQKLPEKLLGRVATEFIKKEMEHRWSSCFYKLHNALFSIWTQMSKQFTVPKKFLEFAKEELQVLLLRAIGVRDWVLAVEIVEKFEMQQDGLKEVFTHSIGGLTPVEVFSLNSPLICLERARSSYVIPDNFFSELKLNSFIMKHAGGKFLGVIENLKKAKNNITVNSNS